jgi:hypothetical protein
MPYLGALIFQNCFHERPSGDVARNRSLPAEGMPREHEAVLRDAPGRL